MLPKRTIARAKLIKRYSNSAYRIELYANANRDGFHIREKAWLDDRWQLTTEQPLPGLGRIAAGNRLLKEVRDAAAEGPEYVMDDVQSYA